MEKFNVRCPDHYPMKCLLPPTDKDYLMTTEKYKAFFIFQYEEQDDWLEPTINGYFSKRNWRLFNAGREGGTGTKFFKICRFALASDFGIASLTPLNNNVFQEIGLMQGHQKPVLYLLNPERNKELPFDMDDQIYIKHNDAASLEEGLSKEMGLFIEKVRLSSGFETAQKELVRNKIDKLSDKGKELLKNLVLEGDLTLSQQRFDDWVMKTFDCSGDPNPLNELIYVRFVIDEQTSGGSKTIMLRKINDTFSKYLEEILWE